MENGISLNGVKMETFSVDGDISSNTILEWPGLESILKLSWFQPFYHVWGHLPPDQVTQSPVQPGHEHFQGFPQLHWATCASVSPLSY